MSGTQRSIQTAAEVRRRAERFASLRAAQRALSRAVHPSELARANEQGRELVIQIQELSTRVRGDDAEAADPASLARIDGLLDETSQRLHEILGRIDIASLRSTVPSLLSEHPEDVRGLVDVLAEGELQSDEDLRKLEYLVTLLCSEQRGGRRVVVFEPTDVSARLRQAALQHGGDDELAEARERRLGDAIARLLHGRADVGSMRDEMRKLKEDMGSGLLHPRVFAAAVAYNVAMANQVAGLVDGSRSIDRLAEELMDGAESGAAAHSSAPPADVLDSPAFGSLMAAFRARVGGREAGGAEALRVVDACPLEGLIPMEIEAFEAGEENETARLTRLAVVVGLVCRHLGAADAPLRGLGIDPELLASNGVAAVMDAMTALARKLFADSEYDAAFHLSEIKTRNLAKLPGARDAAPHAAAARPRERVRDPVPAATSGLPGGWGLSPRQLLLGTLAVAALLGAILWLPSGWSGAIYSGEELGRISPFLESGYRDEQAGEAVFVGRLNASWDHLGTRERREVATGIGRSFAERGVPGMTLSDTMRRRQAEWRDGELVFLAPRPGQAP
jgi:hypothetical protein